MNKSILICLLLLSASIASNGQAVLGKWKTIDDATDEAKSIVRVYEKQGMIYGKIEKLFLEPDEDQNPICDECDTDDPRYKKPIIGMEIMSGLKKDDKEYNGGKILDPESGSVYKCKIWIEDGKLIVRGYIGFSLIGRSQTWLRP